MRNRSDAWPPPLLHLDRIHILTASMPGRQGTVWSPSGHRWLATRVTPGGLVLSEPHAANASGWPPPLAARGGHRRHTPRWWPPPGAARVPPSCGPAARIQRHLSLTLVLAAPPACG